ncbi:MAG TPA: hypothetical protein DDW51_05535 [Cyanobacteria bacterium UBA11367]|nr:hypothetical protein [Cyanobacteria bacterium UBA11367]HBE56794.1 hypothetical protein [Cyanobacteria bacterium UBA11366]HCA94645.1 hypothetical protein [Cyanobacteria bacterium UBA9226]
MRIEYVVGICISEANEDLSTHFCDPTGNIYPDLRDVRSFFKTYELARKFADQLTENDREPPVIIPITICE